MIERDWFGAYSERWGSRLTSESYAHPAKVSYGLAVRIVEHMLERGWFKPGDTVVDPFAGIGGFALPLMAAGCHFIGSELEQHFVDMGQGCDCTGMTTGDWVRFQGRWERARYRDGRHWCPKCLAQVQEIHDERQKPKPTYAQKKRRSRMRKLAAAHKRKLQFVDPLPLPATARARRKAQQTVMFAAVQTIAYRRNSGRIPHTGPHHYAGNVETWGAQGLAGTAVVLQGDSRNLCEVVGQVAGGAVESPPFGGAEQHTGGKPASLFKHLDGRTASRKLSGMPTGDGYSRNPDNLGNLPATDAAHGAAVQAAVGSPPYAGGTVHGNGGIDPAKFAEPERAGHNCQACAMDDYGRAPGQLGAMREGDLQAAISSAPYTASLASDDPDKRGGLYRDPKRRNDKTLTAEYGSSEGQLGAMREGDHGAEVRGVVASPPYEGGTLPPNSIRDGVREEREARLGIKLGGGQLKYGTAQYSSTNGNIGAETGPTFWSSARLILEQTYQLLAPGAYSVWVCKSFVRSGERVDFPNQWRELGEAVGFETVEWIRAWLTEDRGNARALFDFQAGDRVVERGETVYSDGKRSKEIKDAELKRCSFFRRLAESKGSPRIDYEVVLVQRKKGRDA